MDLTELIKKAIKHTDKMYKKCLKLENEVKNLGLDVGENHKRFKEMKHDYLGERQQEKEILKIIK